MRKLKVGLIHRNHPRLNQNRMIGMWSYEVPWFDVVHLPQPKRFVLDRDSYTCDFDVLFWEDGRGTGTIYGSGVPLIYHIVDSTLSVEHYVHRLAQSQQADYVLVDWDRLERFKSHKAGVGRLSYSVNDRLFYPRPKTVDVGFFAHMTDEREGVRSRLENWCRSKGYSFQNGRRFDNDYCEAIGSAKININLNRNSQTRAHRCYDVIASASCLLTSPMPEVSGETWKPGIHFLEWDSFPQLCYNIEYALETGKWEDIAETGYAYSRNHTWEARAVDLFSYMESIL